MNSGLRKIAFFVGLGLLGVSMYWSQDGFNFDIAGQSGYMNMAQFVGWFLAVAVTVMEFIFSSNYNELNKSLLLFGALAYAYSIYTNYEGILHFQGASQNWTTALVLAIIMDAVPEPMIAWALYVSRDGDLIGNIIKAISSAPEKLSRENIAKNHQNQSKSNGNHQNHMKKREIPPDLFQKLGQGRSFETNLHRINRYQEDEVE